MSDVIQGILKQIDALGATAERQIKLAYETDPKITLTHVVIPTNFTLFELSKFCDEHGYSEIRYDVRTRKFFGVRLIEDQEEGT